MRNALTDSTISVHGLLTRPAASDDSLILHPGEVRSVTFAAGQPGTYFYRAVLGKHNPEKDDEREQLSGAFVVDPREGSPPDRILMLNIWGRTVDSANYRNALAINGRSWPYTERLHATVGDTIRWRLINATWRPHPMHLHGFYYSIDASGDGLRDSLYRREDRRLVVTEDMRPFRDEIGFLESRSPGQLALSLSHRVPCRPRYPARPAGGRQSRPHGSRPGCSHGRAGTGNHG